MHLYITSLSLLAAHSRHAWRLSDELPKQCQWMPCVVEATRFKEHTACAPAYAAVATTWCCLPSCCQGDRPNATTKNNSRKTTPRHTQSQQLAEGSQTFGSSDHRWHAATIAGPRPPAAVPQTRQRGGADMQDQQ